MNEPLDRTLEAHPCHTSATEQRDAADEALVSRRMAMGGVAFFGAAMSAITSRAFAAPGAPGSYSNSAIAAEPPGKTPQQIGRG